MSTNNPALVEKRERPLGVWLLTIYAAFFDGILPLIAVASALIAGNSALHPFFSLALILFFSGLLYSAFKTWQGNNRARRYFLILVTCGYLAIAFEHLVRLLTGQAPAGDPAAAYGPIIRGVLYPALYIWYFTRWQTKEFYE